MQNALNEIRDKVCHPLAHVGQLPYLCNRNSENTTTADKLPEISNLTAPKLVNLQAEDRNSLRE